MTTATKPLTSEQIAYLAGIIDVKARISIKRIADTFLPRVATSSPNPALNLILGEATGMKPVDHTRNYTRVGCDQHCTEKHLHVLSKTTVWSVTGMKATVLLHNVLPYLQLQRREAELALQCGLQAPFKKATIKRMTDLGWPIPKEVLGGS